jgi:iron complex transport system substrate-binding protein
MLKVKRVSPLILALLLFLSLAGCAQKNATTAPVGSSAEPGVLASASAEQNTSAAVSAEPSAKTITVEDALGRQVTIPDTMDHVAVTCQGGTTHQISVMGSSDRITAQPSMAKFPMLLKIFPQFNNVIDGGSFDNVNIEELMKAAPDMIFVGITAEKGNKQLDEAGFNTFTMYIGSADVENQLKEFMMTGTLLGNPEQAQQLVDYYNEKISMVQEMVSKIPGSERKTVYYISGGKITSASSGIWGDSLITAAGGINVTKEFASGAKGSEISVEQVMEWNPDVIVTQKGNGSENLDAVRGDTRITDLTAMQNGQVYQFPIGAFWWDRPSPEAPLGVMWLAKTLYPEYTKDIDLEKETKEFYKTFYKYEMSDEEYNSFF